MRVENEVRQSRRFGMGGMDAVGRMGGGGQTWWRVVAWVRVLVLRTCAPYYPRYCVYSATRLRHQGTVSLRYLPRARRK